MDNRRIVTRASLVWVAIILAESVHGTLRMLFLEPALGPVRARQYSVITGSILILAITYLSIRWIGAETTRQLSLIGLGWVVTTVLFEVMLGRFAMGSAWDDIWRDYDVSRGGLMLFGLAFLAMAPLLADMLQKKKRAAQ
ncbi:MAG: hypothetical protein QUS14_07245 [Pyrinomonadaceae bacterium]|nr:hypothetical protein [Pyrinomonadaceae bacterium]